MFNWDLNQTLQDSGPRGAGLDTPDIGSHSMAGVLNADPQGPLSYNTPEQANQGLQDY